MYGYLAAALFAGAATTEIVMIATDRYWPRFSELHNHIAMGIVAAVWIVAAAALLVRRRSRGLAMAAWFLSVVGTAVLLLHSLVGLAIVYLPLTALQIFLLKRTLSGTEWRGLRSMTLHREA